MSRRIATPLSIFALCSLALVESVCADEVGVAGQPMITKRDCQAMATYHAPKGVDYQPGVDVHGNKVAPADTSDGFSYNLPDKVEFDVQVNPINYGQRNTLQSQISAVQAKLAQNPNDTASQKQLSSLQGQLAAISGKYDNTTMSAGHVVVNTRTGEATLNGKPLQGGDQQYLADLCRKAGY